MKINEKKTTEEGKIKERMECDLQLKKKQKSFINQNKKLKRTLEKTHEHLKNKNSNHINN